MRAHTAEHHFLFFDFGALALQPDEKPESESDKKSHLGRPFKCIHLLAITIL
jgi:hypothetical protein